MCLPKLSSICRRTSGLLALVAVAATGASQVTQAAGGYLMRVKYTAGSRLDYTSTTSMISSQSAKGSKPMIVLAPLSLVVSTVKGTKADVKATLGPMTMGKSVLQPTQVVNLTVDTRNQASAGGASQFMGAQMPLKPVKIGQTWTTDAPVPTGMGAGASMRATYKFQGMRTMAGKSMAVIDYTLTGGANGSGTILVLAKDGSLWSNKAVLTLNAGTGAMTVTSEMIRR